MDDWVTAPYGGGGLGDWGGGLHSYSQRSKDTAGYIARGGRNGPTATVIRQFLLTTPNNPKLVNKAGGEGILCVPTRAPNQGCQNLCADFAKMPVTFLLWYLKKIF